MLASAYAFRFVGEWLKWLYTDVTQKLQAGDFSTLPEVHACTAGLKSLTTSATAVSALPMVPSLSFAFSPFNFDASMSLMIDYISDIMYATCIFVTSTGIRQ